MNVKSVLLNVLSRAGGEFISGAELSRQLGVSRNAVWKAVKALEKEGYIIESVTAKGYRLCGSDNILSAEIISAEKSVEHLGGKIIVLTETDSTNNYAKELASSGAAHGTVVIAEKQTGGKGRLGRRFESPSGKGLYVSVIVRPTFDISFAPLITSAAAVAVSEALEKLCGHDTAIKWVNDVYMNGRKICGILTEATLDLESKKLDCAVIGIGINVLEFDFPDELKEKVTSIESETGIRLDRNKLCGELLNRLEYYLDRIESRGHLEGYRKREMLTGNMITATVGNETVTGQALRIDDNADLVILTADGTERKLNSGEASLGRCPKPRKGSKTP